MGEIGCCIVFFEGVDLFVLLFFELVGWVLVVVLCIEESWFCGMCEVWGFFVVCIGVVD